MHTPRDHDQEPLLPIQVLRKRRGGPPRHLVEGQRQQLAVRRKQVRALRPGPKTVPDLACETGLPRHTVFWHLMAMRKYGAISEGEDRGSYVAYALSEEQPKAEASS
jgi:hypothetical protein